MDNMMERFLEQEKEEDEGVIQRGDTPFVGIADGDNDWRMMTSGDQEAYKTPHIWH